MDPIDEHEAYLVGQIRNAQEQYQHAIDTLVKELCRIRSLRPLPPFMLPIKPDPLPGCDCPKCGRGHMVEEVQFAGFTKCDHCGHSLPF
ncbi:hypothetical protein METEAL_15040 [Mesoterricola silvestris]|uniref:Uncharacterized protein n=1 Tax=Mesoterricola silvestris TaxID=2927979 RepID=A0AA48GQG8_9BACT|nr:hypothetical protein METEAL_15040 [Mesoterricola silvestris]